MRLKESRLIVLAQTEKRPGGKDIKLDFLYYVQSWAMTPLKTRNESLHLLKTIRNRRSMGTLLTDHF